MSMMPAESAVAAGAAVVRTEDAVAEQLRLAQGHNLDGVDSTYMDGVIAALEWVTGKSDDPPMDD